MRKRSTSSKSATSCSTPAPKACEVAGALWPAGHPTVADIEPIEIRYPVEQYPAKIVSFNLDKNPIAEGTLLGIKGQYLIFDTGVINIRKYTAYQLAVHQ
jgi:hypothetical protein